MYLLIFPYAFCGIIDPAIRSIVSNKIENNEQGELQGIFTSIMSLAEIISPLFFMWIYYSATRVKPTPDLNYGISFFVCALLALISFFILRWTLKTMKNKGS